MNFLNFVRTLKRYWFKMHTNWSTNGQQDTRLILKPQRIALKEEATKIVCSSLGIQHKY